MPRPGGIDEYGRTRGPGRASRALERHDLGPNIHERNYNGTLTTQFMTEPPWGVCSTAPYGHDSRSINLREVILRHGGEAMASRNAFAKL